MTHFLIFFHVYTFYMHYKTLLKTTNRFRSRVKDMGIIFERTIGGYHILLCSYRRYNRLWIRAMVVVEQQ
jgi:hypothetical protein